MVFLVYRLIFAYVAVLLLWGVFEAKTVTDKVAYGFVAMPFVLRVLLIK